MVVNFGALQKSCVLLQPMCKSSVSLCSFDSSQEKNGFISGEKYFKNVTFNYDRITF